ncbi:hypothetical protein O3P69_011150 [Scylla paramamosain]|uniref:Sushi domain-containing protein n=1 Tax=Scylla paramamosain TaxID=85552 RepID=A0AAW0SU56_SCYPA
MWPGVQCGVTCCPAETRTTTMRVTGGLVMVVVVVMAVVVMVVTAADGDDEVNLISTRTNMSADRCASLPIPQGQVLPHKRSYLVGEMVTVRCARGYMSRWKVVCGPKGVWHTPDGFPMIPRCRYVQCGPPDDIPQGKVEVLKSPPLYMGPGRVSTRVGAAGEGRGGVVPREQCGAVLLHLSHHLTCRHGEWQGELPQCVSQGCRAREPVMNGYYFEITGSWDGQEYPANARVQFVCHTGYVLSGPDQFTCEKGGVWVPRKEVPHCEPLQELIGAELCPVPPEVANTEQKLVRGLVTTKGAVEGTEVSYRCRPHYRNTLAPCVTHILTCKGGLWEGTSPKCEEFYSCMPPPNIRHGTLSDSVSSFPVQAQVYYQCESGYKLMGPSVVTCQEDTGCWTPRLLPVCRRLHQYRDEPLRGDTSILDIHTILVATTGSVIGILLIVLALILYQRAVSPKLVRLRNTSAPPPHPDHDPDRVALIAFPDEQGVPPTYEEAVRHRPAIFEPPGGAGGAGRYTPHAPRSRAHRVGVPGVVGVAVGGRRSRHRDNPDNISYQSIGSARQSSSMRSWSACDSLGSTDTVAAASDSTNVTVDTQSSGGASTGSQAPSCRALAGSLASFDTSSLVNNEGEPLLEEAEAYEGGMEEHPPHHPHHHPHPHHGHHHHHHHHRGEDDHLSLRDSDSLKDHNACPRPPPPPHPRPAVTHPSQEQDPQRGC